MKKIIVEIAKRRQTRHFCVKYHPSSTRENWPSIGALSDALGTYAIKANGLRIAVPIGTAYRTLREAALDAKARYPSLGLAVLDNGQEMFPATYTDAIH